MALSQILLYVLFASIFARRQSNAEVGGSQHMRTANVEFVGSTVRVDATGTSSQYTYVSVLSSSLIWNDWNEIINTRFEVTNGKYSSLNALKVIGISDITRCSVFEQTLTSYLRALVGIAAYVYLGLDISPSISYNALAAPKALYTKAKLGTGEIELDDSIAQGCNVPYEVMKFSFQQNGIVDDSCISNSKYFNQFVAAGTEANLPKLPANGKCDSDDANITQYLVGMKLGSLINIVDISAVKMFLTRVGPIAGVIKQSGTSVKGIILGWESGNDTSLNLIVIQSDGGAYTKQVVKIGPSGQFEVRGTVVFYEGHKASPAYPGPSYNTKQNAKQNKGIQNKLY